MNLDYGYRLLSIGGYSLWTKELVARRWRAYFVNFMFEQISARHLPFADPMEQEVCRVYRTLLPNVVRNPRRQGAILPIFFGCPDFPVFKTQKVSSREIEVNGGRHYNGLFFIPPGSRLRCGLRKHFKNHADWYVRQGRPLERIHVTKMSYGNMTDYALKAFKNGRVSGDDILVLPRSSSEFS